MKGDAAGRFRHLPLLAVPVRPSRRNLASYLGANLVAALPSLQVHDLPHGGGDCGSAV